MGFFGLTTTPMEVLWHKYVPPHVQSGLYTAIIYWMAATWIIGIGILIRTAVYGEPVKKKKKKK